LNVFPQKQAVKYARSVAPALLNQCLEVNSMERELESLRLLTLSEAAQMLHVSTRTLQRMIRKNDLPAFKVGGQWRVRESQLAQWIRLREGSCDPTENGHNPT
jgi:excisionase family DNA binding protein